MFLGALHAGSQRVCIKEEKYIIRGIMIFFFFYIFYFIKNVNFGRLCLVWPGSAENPAAWATGAERGLPGLAHPGDHLRRDCHGVQERGQQGQRAFAVGQDLDHAAGGVGAVAVAGKSLRPLAGGALDDKGGADGSRGLLEP